MASRLFRPVNSLTRAIRPCVPTHSFISSSSSVPFASIFGRYFSGSSSATLSGTARSKLSKAKRLAKKKTVAQLISVRSGPVFHIDEAIRIVQALGKTSAFDQTVDVQIQLGIDPRKTNQHLRGVTSLPHGTGKKVEIAVFAKGEKAEEARKAGATYVGAEDLIEQVQKGTISFNKAIATPDMMPLVGRVARILGPRGLMPNPRLGTVTVNVKDAVSAALRGQASFRTERRGIVSVGIGKVSFPASALRDNLKALFMALYDNRPEGFRGTFFKQAFLTSTMGEGIPIDATLIDPTSNKFMAEWDGKPQHLVSSVVSIESVDNASAKLT